MILFICIRCILVDVITTSNMFFIHFPDNLNQVMVGERMWSVVAGMIMYSIVLATD